MSWFNGSGGGDHEPLVWRIISWILINLILFVMFVAYVIKKLSGQP
jgi:predicted membrane-bound dolichyl-phosphate-mannose-protein mannosyltransferase